MYRCSISLATLCVLFASHVQGFGDDFEGDHIADGWSIVAVGSGPYVEQTDGELKVVIPHDSTEADGLMAAGLATQCTVEGDFDVEVDYRLETWPGANGVRVGLVAFDLGQISQGAVHRVSFGPSGDNSHAPSESYVLHNLGGGITYVGTDNTSGRLRLVRSGTTWTGFFWDSGSWSEIGSHAGTAVPVSLHIRAWSHDYAFGGNEVVIAFDDFAITQGVGCEDVVGVERRTLGQIKSLFR